MAVSRRACMRGYRSAREMASLTRGGRRPEVRLPRSGGTPSARPVGRPGPWKAGSNPTLACIPGRLKLGASPACRREAGLDAGGSTGSRRKSPPCTGDGSRNPPSGPRHWAGIRRESKHLAGNAALVDRGSAFAIYPCVPRPAALSAGRTLSRAFDVEYRRGGVAQSVEQGNHNPCVGGSNPSAATSTRQPIPQIAGRFLDTAPRCGA
jgi:hypothetical protein